MHFGTLSTTGSLKLKTHENTPLEEGSRLGNHSFKGHFSCFDVFLQADFP